MTNRNITKKSAPVIPAAPKSVKISASMHGTLRGAIQQFGAARAEFEDYAGKAKAAHAKLIAVAEMHDALFASLIVDGGATREDFKHGFELGQNTETGEYCLRAKVAPVPQQ